MLQDLAASAGGRAGEGLHLPALAPHGSLAARLQARAGRPHVLAELKRASPSEGPLLTRPVQAYLRDLRAGGATAISVVTAGGPFGGRVDDLRDAHREGLPVLMKDFITTEKQVEVARHNGASAILLIERLLAPARREELVRSAHAHGLEVLLEVHSDAETAGALASRADVLGVNSRDLATLAIDVPAALRLVQRIAGADPRPVLLLSGSNGPLDADLACAAGAAGVLVGTSLLRARHPATALRALRRPLVKVCGNRTPADVAMARGADLVGVIVGAASPRDVPIDEAKLLLAQARLQGAAAVVVTRGQHGDDLIALAATLRPDFIQVHGHLAPAAIEAMHRLGVGVLEALGPGMAPTPGSDGTVTDTTADGGSGRRHARAVPGGRGLHLVAGGLDAGSAAQAIAASGANGADASSALETGGRKDAAKVAAFIASVHASTRRLRHGA